MCGAIFGHGHSVNKDGRVSKGAKIRNRYTQVPHGKELYKLMLHTKYQGSRASDFRQEVLSFLLGLAFLDKQK